MNDDLRAELNRLWTDMQATQMLLAHVAAKSMDKERIDAWHDRMTMHLDGRQDLDEGLRVNMGRALDHLAVHLRDARHARDAGAPPG